MGLPASYPCLAPPLALLSANHPPRDSVGAPVCSGSLPGQDLGPPLPKGEEVQAGCSQQTPPPCRYQPDPLLCNVTVGWGVAGTEGGSVTHQGGLLNGDPVSWVEPMSPNRPPLHCGIPSPFGLFTRRC